MGMDRTTKWVCDVCGKIEEIKSKSDDSGTSLPDGWIYGKITLSSDHLYSERKRFIVMCIGCRNSHNNIDYRDKSSLEELKKPFWQKLFGREP